MPPGFPCDALLGEARLPPECVLARVLHAPASPTGAAAMEAGGVSRCTEVKWETMEKCCFMSVPMTRSITICGVVGAGGERLLLARDMREHRFKSASAKPGNALPITWFLPASHCLCPLTSVCLSCCFFLLCRLTGGRMCKWRQQQV